MDSKVQTSTSACTACSSSLLGLLGNIKLCMIILKVSGAGCYCSNSERQKIMGNTKFVGKDHADVVDSI
jgi:hypothetical protein